MAAEFGQHGASQNGGQVADRDLLKRQEIEKVIRNLVEGDYEPLYNEFKDDLKLYPDEGIEFVFHHACKFESPSKTELEFIEDVIKECLKLGKNEASEILKHLFNLPNSDGYTPFHVAIESHEEVYLKEFLERVKASSDLAFSILVNTCDSSGWSPIHKILNKKPMLDVLRLVKEKIDVSAVLGGSNATALHFAIYYDSPKALDIILEDKSIDLLLNTLVKRSIVYGSKYKDGKKRSCEYWSPLQLAAMRGNPDVVGPLLRKIDKIYDSSKRNNHGLSPPDKYDDAIPALHLAAASGVPEVMKMFITDVFDPIKLTSDDRTPIHFAIDSSTPKFDNAVERKRESNEKNAGTRKSKFHDPFAIEVESCGSRDTDLRRTNSETSITSEDEDTRQACITMLMQAGVDTWQKDRELTMAEPGPEASGKLRMWWYKALARDTSEAKKNLNDAANAISVVAALVATASYVGPLQPPLGYGTSDPSVLDLVQTTKLPIRVFVVTNCLSFYLAIGSILFAVVPSLPMPQESLYEEWQRSKRTIGVAILFLLLSIVGVLISFAAASNVGMEDNYSWNRLGLAFYPTLLGSLACLFGITIFSIRLLRLVFDKDPRIRRLYQRLPRV